MEYEVIIVGAGPAGLSTALFLLSADPALAGRILVLERKTFPRDKFCAGAIGGRGDRLLSSIGVKIRVPSVAISGIRMTVPQGRAERTPGFIGRTIRRIEFDSELAAATRARGVTLLEGAPVSDIHVSSRRVHVLAGESTFSGRYLVGADGVGSFVRRWLGLPFGSLRARVVEVDTERVGGDPPEDVLHFDVSDRSLNGYAWDFPTPLHDRILMSRGVYSLGFSGEESPDVAEILDKRLRGLGIDPGSCKKRQMIERGFEPHRAFARGRVMLAGEAAGVDPITGEGIAEAIQYGAIAGPYLAEKVARNEPSLADWPGYLVRSTVGADLFLRRWGAFLCFKYARRPVEVLFARVPRFLDLATGLFAGGFPVRFGGPPWS